MANELTAWDKVCIADSEAAIIRFAAMIEGKADHIMVRSDRGDSRPMPVSYFKGLIADNERQIERIRNKS